MYIVKYWVHLCIYSNQTSFYSWVCSRKKKQKKRSSFHLSLSNQKIQISLSQSRHTITIPSHCITNVCYWKVRPRSEPEPASTIPCRKNSLRRPSSLFRHFHRPHLCKRTPKLYRCPKAPNHQHYGPSNGSATWIFYFRSGVQSSAELQWSWAGYARGSAQKKRSGAGQQLVATGLGCGR